jgi:hypothetical protein
VAGLDAYTPIMVLAIACEMTLLGFLYFISRFYEAKFRERTYYNAYLVPIAAFVLALAATLLGADFFLTMMLLNLLTLLVLLVFGLRLSRMMGRVSK